jgi:hypothetical protein
MLILLACGTQCLRARSDTLGDRLPAQADLMVGQSCGTYIFFVLHVNAGIIWEAQTGLLNVFVSIIKEEYAQRKRIYH